MHEALWREMDQRLTDAREFLAPKKHAALTVHRLNSHMCDSDGSRGLRLVAVLATRTVMIMQRHIKQTNREE